MKPSLLHLQLAMLAFSASIACIGPKASLNAQMWVLSPLERAQPFNGNGSKHSVQLFAARGEYESFQVVLQADEDGLKNVSLKASDLVSSEGFRIGAENISSYRQHFVRVEHPSPSQGRSISHGPGLYPDALLPFANGSRLPATPGNIQLRAGQNVPVWVDVFVPRDAKAGVYSGRLEVSTSDGAGYVPISLTVWDFELPLRPSLKSSFGYQSSGEGIDELLVRHKLGPSRADPASCDESCTVDERERELGVLGFWVVNVGVWSGADIGNCKMKPPPPRDYFMQAASRREPGLFLYNYTADEIDSCPAAFKTLREWARNIRGTNVRNLVVMAPQLELLDNGSGTGHSVVDIWVVLPKMHEASLDEVRRAQRKGDEVWSYNALSQDDYSPKWLLDHDLINYRVQAGFINQSLGLTGLLYWRVDNRVGKQWDNVNNQGMFSRANYPGEGLLIYSGSPVGMRNAMPSMRLKQLRDGVEDYEYVEILKQLGRGDWALEVTRSVGADWRTWSSDPAKLEAARIQLGEEIQRLTP